MAQSRGTRLLIGGLRGRLRKLRREMEAELLVVSMGMAPRTSSQRSRLWRRSCMRWSETAGTISGKAPGLTHPFIVALRTVMNLDAIIVEQGTMVGHLLGEYRPRRGG